MQLLLERGKTQLEQRPEAGEAWANPLNLVFTNPPGGNLCAQTVYLQFKKQLHLPGVPLLAFTICEQLCGCRAAIRRCDKTRTRKPRASHSGIYA